MRRRLLFIFGSLFAGLVIALVTLPFWFGAAARSLGASRGLSFDRYERIGYARFALEDVEFRRGNVRVTSTKIEAPTPLLWLWRHWRDHPNPIVAQRWLVEIERNPAPPKPVTTARGWMPLRVRLQRIAAQLDRWLPRLETGAGVVRFPRGEIALDSGKWRDRELSVVALRYKNLSANASLAFAEDSDVLRLVARTLDESAAVALESRGTQVSGEVEWLDQSAALKTAFAPQGWLPAEALVDATEWSIPGAKLKLGDLYGFVRGSAHVEWREGTILVRANAAGEPVSGKNAPPLHVDLRGEGDLQAFTIEALQATIPGIDATLSEPVTIGRDGKLRDTGARLVLQADLARQPWFAARGAVTGEARVVSGANAAPQVAFSLAAQDIAAQGVELSAVDAEGTLAWPRLEISEATLAGGEGERLTLRAGWNFRTKEIIGASIEGTLRRESVARWLPDQPEFTVVTLTAQAEGTIEEMQHSGRAEAEGVKFKGMNPLVTTISWNGRGIGAEDFELSAKAGATSIVAQGSVSRESLQLTAFDLAQGNEPRLSLESPAALRWKPSLQVQSLHLSGPQGNFNLAATAGETGKIELSAANISSRWLADLVPQKGPSWQLTLFALVGNWDRGPMVFSATAGATLELGEGRTASVNAAARGDAKGLRIEALRATEGDATVVNASGRLPVTLTPSARPLLRVDYDGRVVLAASAAPNAVFWQKLAAISGVELVDPEAVVNIKGTWQRPQGSVSFEAARIAVDPKRIARPVPSIEDIDIRVTGDPGGFTLDAFTFKVEGQLVRAHGRMPVPHESWSKLFKQPLVTLRQGADLQIEIPDAEVAMFTRFLPAVLAPQGRLQASVIYKQGGLGGFVRLRDAASRPLGPLGVLQEVTADLELEDRTLHLRRVTARSGGQPVTLSGTVELPEKKQPRFDLALKGENLPFVRETGLLLRGDLDLKLQTPTSGAPRLTGAVTLRDSLFLSDVRAFLPGGGASAARRPPYFSVDTPPVNTWRLAVDVTGEEFMRLRTPVFNGVASARFRLRGTLGEPRAIGEVEIDEGVVRMPFARFEVQQGFARLTEADPYEPTLYIRATGRRYGYDLTVEIDGEASAPNVVFTSSPPLESEQVLLMVMTGAAPSDNIAVTGTQRVTRLGTFVGQSLLSSFTSDGADADRLSITSGEKISDQGNETYNIEYKLTDRWTVTGEYNEFDEYNAGLKWRIFRGEPKTAPDGKGENARK